MLAASHNRAYQDFLTLLTTFQQKLSPQEAENNQPLVRQEFQKMSEWFEQNLVSLSCQDLAPAIAPRWQAVQTEILREFKLLSTDILFLATSRQQTTQLTRLQSIDGRLTKLISYCQIMIKDLN
ncbi:MAG: heterocyst frequency control protein PatD [Hydrococcus sp. SU_1_0]|nr:heterocyst frequency control protein PatD [Hydrococcus sp. SU_1_0]